MTRPPYQKQTFVEIADGDAVCVPLPAPSYGTLTRFIAKQTTGALDGFTVTLFSSEAPGLVGADSFDDDPAAFDAASFQICPPFVVAGGAPLHESYTNSFPYAASDMIGEGRRRTGIFARIETADNGPKRFELSYTIL